LAELQGASLEQAQLQGASLGGTQLQGASLREAQLQAAKLHSVFVFVWRVDIRNIDAKAACVVAPETAPKYQGLDCPVGGTCGWSAASFSALTGVIDADVPRDYRREKALARITVLDPDRQEVWHRNPRASLEPLAREAWSFLERSSPPSIDYAKVRAGILRPIGCDAANAAYVIVGFYRTGAVSSVLAANFLDETNCPAARSLSKPDKSALRETRDGHRRQLFCANHIEVE
jgi:hypothetical protein